MRSFPRRTVAALVAGVLTSFVVATPAFAAVPVAGDASLKLSPVSGGQIDLAPYVTADDGDSLTYTVDAQPADTTVTFDGSVAQVAAPGAGLAGQSDSFTYTVSGNDGTSGDGTVTLTYNTVPTAGAVNQDVSPIDPTVVHLAVGGSDADGDSLTYAITQQPATGALGAVSGSDVTFTPPTGNPSGTVTFSYDVSDGVDTSTAATVTLTYEVALTGTPAAATVSPEHTSSIPLASYTVGGNDDALTYSVITPATEGLVTFDSTGKATYDPASNPTGPDTFTYRVSDGHTHADATVTVNFNHVPTTSPPSPGDTASDPIRIPATHSSVAIALTADAQDNGQTLTYSVPTQPTNATVAMTGSNAVITPKASAAALQPNQSHVDSFGYKVSDTIDSATATVYVRYNKVPTASNDSINVVHGQSVTVDLTSLAADGDGDTLGFPRVSGPTYGSVNGGTGAQLTYTAPSNYAGVDSVQYRAYDGYDNSATKTLTFHVTDAAPTATAASVQTGYETRKSIALSGSDADDSASSLTYSLDGQANNGHVSLNSNGQCTYTPNAGFAGRDSFYFTTSDPIGATSTATKVTVTVAKASTKITSKTFSPKRPTPGDSVTATVKVRTSGSPVAGIVVIHDGSKSYRGTMMGSSGTIYLHHLSAGTHHFTIDYLGTHTTAPTSTTATLKVAKIATKLKITTKPKQLTTKKRGVAKVTVSAPHATVNGAVATISEGHKTLGRAVVRRGVAKITLPKLRLGQHNLTVHYAGTSSASSVTKKWVVRVSLG